MWRPQHRELSPETVTAWWSTLGAGLVVAVVVWALLHGLLRAVMRVDERVTALWTVGKHVARNTQAGHLLNTTSTRATELAGAVDAGSDPAGGADA